jgi:hypothetical protein
VGDTSQNYYRGPSEEVPEAKSFWGRVPDGAGVFLDKEVVKTDEFKKR